MAEETKVTEAAPVAAAVTPEVTKSDTDANAKLDAVLAAITKLVEVQTAAATANTTAVASPESTEETAKSANNAETEELRKALADKEAEVNALKEVLPAGTNLPKIAKADVDAVSEIEKMEPSDRLRYALAAVHGNNDGPAPVMVNRAGF